MDAFLAPGGTVALLVAFWIDTRRRTNGAGPLAQKLDELHDEVRDVRDDIAEVRGELHAHVEAHV